MPIKFTIKAYRSILLIIGVGYLCVLVGLAVVGMRLNQNIADLKKQTEYLYQHPFQVNSAARDARLAIAGIRNELLYAIADTRTIHVDLAGNIDRYDAELDRNLQTIEAKFLGDMAKVREVRKLCVNWKHERAAIIALLEQGRYSEATQVWETRTAPIYESIVPRVDYVVSFSSAKARFFAEQAQRQAKASGKRFRLVMTAFWLLTLFAGITTVLVVMAALRKHEAMEEQVHQLAQHDTLTGLANRRLLNDRLPQAMAASKRSGCYGALLFLDLDNFKPLNDTYGHAVGDLLLIEVAERLKSCVREVDTVARFGGDEFVVMLNELDANKTKSTAEAELVAEKILAALSAPYQLTIKQEGQPDALVEHRGSVSIGVTLFISNEIGHEAVIKQADQAMYQAKEAGHNRIQLYEQGAELRHA